MWQTLRANVLKIFLIDYPLINMRKRTNSQMQLFLSSHQFHHNTKDIIDFLSILNRSIANIGLKCDPTFSSTGFY